MTLELNSRNDLHSAVLKLITMRKYRVTLLFTLAYSTVDFSSPQIRMSCACSKRAAWEKVSAVSVRFKKKMEITMFDELVKAAGWLKRIEHSDALQATW